MLFLLQVFHGPKYVVQFVFCLLGCKHCCERVLLQKNHRVTPNRIFTIFYHLKVKPMTDFMESLNLLNWVVWLGFIEINCCGVTISHENKIFYFLWSSVICHALKNINILIISTKFNVLNFKKMSMPGTPWPCLKLRCAGGHEFNPRLGQYTL